jgi:hypothetical protein
MLFNINGKARVWHTPCFVLLCWDFSNHGISCCALGIFRKLLMSRVHWLGLRLFRGMMWKILIFEWILFLEIQTNCKNWVWKEKISWANVFTLGPTAQATLLCIKTNSKTKVKSLIFFD